MGIMPCAVGILVCVVLLTLGIRRGPVTWDESYYMLIRNTWRSLIEGGGIWVLNGKEAAYHFLRAEVAGVFHLNLTGKPAWFFLLLVASLLGEGWGTMVLVPVLASALWVSHLVKRYARTWVEMVGIILLVAASPMFLFINAGGFANPLAGAWLYLSALLLLQEEELTRRRSLLAGLALALAVMSHYTAGIPGLLLSGWFGMRALRRQAFASIGWIATSALSVFVLVEGATYMLSRLIMRLHPGTVFEDYIHNFFYQFGSIHDATVLLFPPDYYLRVLTTLEGWMWCLAVGGVMLLMLFWKKTSYFGRALAGTVFVSGIAFSLVQVKGTRVIGLLLPLIYLMAGEGYMLLKAHLKKDALKKVRIVTLFCIAVIMVERTQPLKDILTLTKPFPKVIAAIEAREKVIVGAIYSGLGWPIYTAYGYRPVAAIPIVADDLIPSSSVSSTVLIAESPRFYEHLNRMKQLCEKQGAPLHELPWSTIAAYQWHWDNDFGRNKDALAYCVLPGK